MFTTCSIGYQLFLRITRGVSREIGRQIHNSQRHDRISRPLSASRVRLDVDATKRNYENWYGGRVVLWDDEGRLLLVKSA